MNASGMCLTHFDCIPLATREQWIKLHSESPKTHSQRIENEAEERGMTRSEHIRDVLEPQKNTDELQREHKRDMAELQQGYEERLEELQSELDELQTEISRVNSEQRQLLDL